MGKTKEHYFDSLVAQAEQDEMIPASFIPQVKTWKFGPASFADEVNVSRVLALFQHIRGNKTERELACAAVKSSELLTQEDVPVLERIGPRWITHEWDQTWTGRIAEFCIEKGFQVIGGQRNRGHRAGDITIMSNDVF